MQKKWGTPGLPGGQWSIVRQAQPFSGWDREGIAALREEKSKQALDMPIAAALPWHVKRCEFRAIVPRKAVDRQAGRHCFRCVMADS